MDRFGVDFGADLASQMTPQGCARTGAPAPWGGPRRSWGRLGSVLLSSCGSRSLLLPSWARFGVVFGCSWGRFGAFGGFLRCFNRRFVVAS